MADPVGESTRDTLIRAGVEILDNEGINAVGLRAITRRAGVSHGAPRRHFPTHRALLAEIARSGVEDLVVHIGPILDDPSHTPVDRINSAAQRYVSFAQERRDMFELMFRHDLLDSAGGNLRSMTLPLVARIRDLIQECSPSDDGWSATLRLWSGIHGLAVFAGNRTLEPLAEVTPIDINALTLDVVSGVLRH